MTDKLVNTKWVLAARPRGAPRQSDFQRKTEAVAPLAAGRVLCRTIYLSIDPYMRGRMNEGASYAEPVALGDTMVGGTVSEVVESRADGFAAGDFVLGQSGWQEYASVDPRSLTKLDPARAPLSTALGLLGMPGLTAYVGLLDFGRPEAGETVVVSAATGAVGSVVGQIARLKGCRVVGVAGAEEKCRYAVAELGFDACVSYKRRGFAEALREACPQGVDVYFENVGGGTLFATLGLLNVGARVPLCGLISWYNLQGLPDGPDKSPKLMATLLTRRVTVRGYIITDHLDRREAFLEDVSLWYGAGHLKTKEHIVEGLKNAPEALRGQLVGKNFGKLLIQVGADPSRAPAQPAPADDGVELF